MKNFLDKHNLLKNKVNKELEFTPRVLIDPNTVVKNDDLPKGFYRSDSFLSNRRKEFDNESIMETFSSMFSLRKIDTIKQIAQLLIDNHKPIQFDYENKFKIKNEEVMKIKEENTQTIEEKTCPRCKKGKLVIRKTKNQNSIDKYGTDSFLGCDRFPKCRYNENM